MTKKKKSKNVVDVVHMALDLGGLRASLRDPGVGGVGGVGEYESDAEPNQTSVDIQTDLLQTSALGAHEGHAVAVVDVGGDGGHAVAALRVERVSRHQLGAAQGLVDVQTTEGVIDGHRLQTHGDKESRRGGRGREEKRRRRDRGEKGVGGGWGKRRRKLFHSESIL